MGSTGNLLVPLIGPLSLIATCSSFLQTVNARPILQKREPSWSSTTPEEDVASGPSKDEFKQRIKDTLTPGVLTGIIIGSIVFLLVLYIILCKVKGAARRKKKLKAFRENIEKLKKENYVKIDGLYYAKPKQHHKNSTPPGYEAAPSAQFRYTTQSPMPVRAGQVRPGSSNMNYQPSRSSSGRPVSSLTRSQRGSNTPVGLMGGAVVAAVAGGAAVGYSEDQLRAKIEADIMAEEEWHNHPECCNNCNDSSAFLSPEALEARANCCSEISYGMGEFYQDIWNCITCDCENVEFCDFCSECCCAGGCDGCSE